MMTPSIIKKINAALTGTPKFLQSLYGLAQPLPFRRHSFSLSIIPEISALKRGLCDLGD
jgi:hypothetical protein